MPKAQLIIILLLLIFSACKDDVVNPPVNQSNYSIAALYPTYASTYAVQVVSVNFRDYAFIADGASGMQIIDVTVRNQPDSVSSLNVSGTAVDISVAPVNGYLFAFVVVSNGGCVIADVSDPFNPYIVSVISLSSALSLCIDIQNEFLYIGDNGGNLNFYDIAPLPAPPISRFVFGTSNTPVTGIILLSDFLYCSYGSTGLVIYNVSNRYNPVLSSVTNTTGIAYDVTATAGYVYLADGFNGTLIYNVTNPASPTLVSTMSPSGEVQGVAVNNITLYTADNTYGSESYDISSPSSPVKNGYIKLNSSALDIVYFGGYLFLAGAQGGMAILQPTN
jgi:hypothetical protein